LAKGEGGTTEQKANELKPYREAVELFYDADQTICHTCQRYRDLYRGDEQIFTRQQNSGSGESFNK
jgi:hypothetical protein